MRETGSHLTASVNKWEFAASYGEIMTGLHTDVRLNARVKGDKRPALDLPHPWKSSATTEPVTPEERARLKAELLSRSAFAN